MQNKANLPDNQMSVTYVKTKSYEQKPMEGKPLKQSQSNPTCGEHRRTICGEPACTAKSRARSRGAQSKCRTIKAKPKAGTARANRKKLHGQTCQTNGGQNLPTLRLVHKCSIWRAFFYPLDKIKNLPFQSKVCKLLQIRLGGVAGPGHYKVICKIRD